MSVETPLVVPTTNTLAPIIGSPVESVTVPETVICCAFRLRHDINNVTRANKRQATGILVFFMFDNIKD